MDRRANSNRLTCRLEICDTAEYNSALQGRGKFYLLNQFNLRRGGDLRFRDQLGAFVDELRHDAHRDFLHTLRANSNSHWAGDAFELVGCRQFFLDKMLE